MVCFLSVNKACSPYHSRRNSSDRIQVLPWWEPLGSLQTVQVSWFTDDNGYMIVHQNHCATKHCFRQNVLHCTCVVRVCGCHVIVNLHTCVTQLKWLIMWQWGACHWCVCCDIPWHAPQILPGSIRWNWKLAHGLCFNAVHVCDFFVATVHFNECFYPFIVIMESESIHHPCVHLITYICFPPFFFLYMYEWAL